VGGELAVTPLARRSSPPADASAEFCGRTAPLTTKLAAPVQPGNSGSPLLGHNGSVVGVVVGKLNALKVAEVIGDIPQNVNFAVSLRTLQSFLNANDVPYVLDDNNGTKSPADITAEVSRYTVLLECLR
jgi:S1-C subfamily serine protease